MTVAYEAPATGAKLQDEDNLNHPVPDFAAQTATNDTPADSTEPAFVSASMNGTTLTVVFDEPLDESVTQAGALAPFRIRATTNASGQSYSISGNTVTVTFHAAAAVSHGETVTVGYVRPAATASRFKDLSGNELADFSGQHKPVTNVTPPAYSSASVDGDELAVTFDGALDESAVPAGSAFTVKATRSGTERDVDLAATNPVSVSGSEVTLALAEAVLAIDTVTVAYEAPATGAKLQDEDNLNHPVPDFAAQTATNDTPADSTEPAFVSASMNGTTLTVVFDEPLDESVTQAGALAPFRAHSTATANAIGHRALPSPAIP